MLGTGVVNQEIHVANMADFLHRYPAAYAYWRAEVERGRGIRDTEAVGANWFRQVSEAVTELEATETNSAA